MDAESQRVLEYLTEVEEGAEDVLATKQQIVDLDTKRNQNREALNALKTEMSDSEKVKVCFGNMFIKFPKSKTREMIQKGHPELRGYNLSPLSTEEIKAMNSILKR
ncbi:putative p53 and DNA damage-regulated protein 1 [Scophthalmus maximus]|uniref:Putative p53 and DNA damage-regulated protein 1 n=1 Tax=Scophthalmus maximus TaxID=52904 RepID=A0A2U9BHN7_SCOMX|nr:putative p53 and DNA damage-regulated protein 1 [Scophthalmus maximus]